MFDRVYQGAPSLEILNPQGTNPIGLWKVVGSVQRVFDKALRGHVYQLVNNSAQTMLQLPKEDKSKQGLGLVQPCLVLQVFLPQNREKPFALEVGVTDNSRSKRRLVFSATSQEAQPFGPHSSAAQVRLPLNGLRRGTWLNLCLDMDSLVRGTFGQVMKSLDSISVHAECRLRRIFTMRSLPQQSEIVGCVADANCESEYEQPTVPMLAPCVARLEPIPRSHEFPAGVDQHTQLLSAEQALPDAPLSMQSDLNHEVGKLMEEESEECGGVTTCKRLSRSDVSLEPLALSVPPRIATSDRITNGLAPICGSNGQTDPVGYEEMIRRASEGREEKDNRGGSEVPVGAVRQSTSNAETNGDQLQACTLPEAGRQRRLALSGTDKVGKCATTRPVTRDALGMKNGVGQSFQTACLGATAPRRKSHRRPGDLSIVQTRNASDPGCRRFPTSTKNVDRSTSNPPSNPKVRQPRPLPLEIGAPRAARDDGSTSAPCSGSSGYGAPPSSARRGRRPGARLPAAQQSAKGDDESISPTPSAARRRRELAKQTLHKTAEIYGVHKHTPLSKGYDRGIEESRTPGFGARGDEEDAEFLGLASPLGPKELKEDAEFLGLPSPQGQSSLPEVTQSMRQMQSLTNMSHQAREPQVDDDETPIAALGSLEALPECRASTSDVSAVLQAAIALAPGELSTSSTLPFFSLDQRRWPHVLEAESYSRPEATYDGPHTPASSSSLASPPRVLGGKLEAPDMNFHDEVCSSALTSPRAVAIMGEHPEVLSAREVAVPPADAWATFGSTVRHHHSCWPPLGARSRGGAHAQDNGAWANGNGRGNSTSETHPENCETLPERSEASGNLTPYAPPQRRAAGGDNFSEGDHLGDCGHGFVASVEDLRRIKSLSPPRQTFQQRVRPQPIISFEDSLRHLDPVDPSAPSSAPSDYAVRNCNKGCTGQSVEDNAKTQKSSFEVVDHLFQQRPFTPPVVPVGKLLRGVYNTAKLTAPGTEPATRDPSLGSYQGPPGVLETSAVRSKYADLAVKDGNLQDKPYANAMEEDRSHSLSEHTCLRDTIINKTTSAGEQVLEAIYDPLLDVYYDPVSNKYYERRRDASDVHDVQNHLRA